MNDLNQVREFIAALTGSSTSPVTFQVFYDPKDGTTRPDLAVWFTATIDDSIEYLNWSQSQNCGVYMTVNGTDGIGRESENIVDFRTMFVDFDGMTEPTWSLAPHLIQKRDDTHGHAFWLIDGDVTADEWTVLQKHLSLYYSSDNQVIDPARVARVPGTLHLKDPSNPTSYQITHNQSTADKYTVQEIRDAHVLSAELDAKLHQWISAREGKLDGAGYERNEREENKFIGFVSNAAHPAVQGSGTLTLIQVASFGHDHGIPVDIATDILWNHYNPRCEPPWGQHERQHFNSVVQRAYKYATSAPGCKTAKAHWNANPLQEPSCGWEGQKALVGNTETKPETEHLTVPYDSNSAVHHEDYYGCRITSADASTLLSQLNGKSAHYDFARCYDGKYYEGTRIIRNQKTFFEYNGKVWTEVLDEAVRSGIQRDYSQYKPADSFTSGVFRVFCDHVNVKTVENGKWINDPDRDTSNVAVFENGIVDLGENHHTVLPHTHEFFTFNALPFNYNPSAQCPTWLKFLDDIWGTDVDLKRQLQQFMGYCLTSDTSLQKFATFMGKPRSGKGTITEVISEMVGHNNISSPALSGLVKDSALSAMSTSSVALIPDAHNVNPNIRDSVLSTLKAITGEDSIEYHEMYKGSQTKKFTCKVIISTNNVPDFNDPSGALVARMLVFPFQRSFVGRENPNLRRELLAEIEGIIQWAIAGLRDLRANGNRFTESSVGIAEKEEIREDMFPLSQYVREMTDLNETEWTLVSDLYNAYRMWATTNGSKSPMTMVMFNKCLRNSSLPIYHERRESGRGFVGITVKGSTGFAGMPMPQGNV
ncbi:DNA polymerase/primase [Vibrio phage 159E36-2a]